MSRRETFLESAKAANDRALEPGADSPRRQVDSAQLNAVASELRAIRAALAQLESLLRERRCEAGSRRAGWLTWLLAGALIAILGVTALRPDWALRPRQKSELALGQRMHRLLDHMEEAERSEVLASLWDGSSPPPETSD